MVSFYAALAYAPAVAVASPAALPRPVLQVSPAQIAAVAARLGLHPTRPVLAFAPGAEFGSAKRWPTSHFAFLAQLIRRAHPEVQIVLLGSPKDKAVCDEITALHADVINLAGSTTLADAIALIAGAAAMVSNDSGLLHIASALNRPIVALYGPTDPTHAPPFSDIAQSLSLHLSCAPCRQRECPLQHHNCMRNLTPDMVWLPLRGMLATAHRL